MSKSPLAIVQERFGDKQKLVDAVKALATDDLIIDRVSPKGLERVSNAKLLRLHDLLEGVKKEHGSRAKLIAAVAKAEGHEGNAAYEKSLERFPTPRLVDRLAAATKRAS